jgi:hypothetical protein
MVASQKESKIEKLFHSLFGEDEASYERFRPESAPEPTRDGVSGYWISLLEGQMDMLIRSIKD